MPIYIMLVKLEDALPEANNQCWLDGFEREIRLGFELEKANRMARVAKMKEVERIQNRKHIDGIGQRVGEIDARTFFRWQQEEEGFWDDPKNVKRFLNDNPEYKVRKHG